MSASGHPNASDRETALAIATVGQSLRFQSPSAWRVLAAMGLKVTYAASSDGWSPVLDRAGGFQAIRGARSLRPDKVLGGFLDLRRLLARPWGLVQVQSPVMGVLARIVPRRSPLIYVAHGFHFHTDGRRGSNYGAAIAERMLAGRCDALGVVCAEDFTAAVRLGLHRRTCLWRLPGAGVDLADFPLAPRREAASMRLLFIGELNENKDPLWFIDVVRRLRSQGREVTGTIVGDGPLRPLVVAAVSADAAALTWVPHTDYPGRFIRDSDVLLMPSRREGLPRVVIESLASGRPVVARSNRGTRELLTTAALGRLMAPSSTLDNWARAVLAVRSTNEDVAELRESVRRFSSEGFMTSYRGLVEHVLTQPSAVGAYDLGAQQRSRADAV